MDNYSELCLKENFTECERKYLCMNCIYHNTEVKNKCDYGDIQTEAFQDEIKKTIENFKDIEVYSVLVDDEIPEIEFELHDHLEKGENFKEDVRDAGKLIEEMDDNLEVKFCEEEDSMSVKITYKEDKKKEEKGLDNIVQLKWDVRALYYALKAIELQAYGIKTAWINDKSGKEYISNEDIKLLNEVEASAIHNQESLSELFNKLREMQHEDE